jgi:hypothetical protein
MSEPIRALWRAPGPWHAPAQGFNATTCVGIALIDTHGETRAHEVAMIDTGCSMGLILPGHYLLELAVPPEECTAGSIQVGGGGDAQLLIYEPGVEIRVNEHRIRMPGTAFAQAPVVTIGAPIFDHFALRVDKPAGLVELTRHVCEDTAPVAPSAPFT